MTSVRGPAPPTREVIAAFMVKHTARLPTTAACPLEHGVLPYKYDGCDYALALYACFPARCIDLAGLSWSPQPLAAQRRGNLAAFCEAALRLGLPDCPALSLAPAALQPTPSCIVHHLKVQHWLHSLAGRFPPDAAAFEPATIRAVQACRQVGSPLLIFKRPRSSRSNVDDGDEASNTHDSADAVRAVVNDPSRCCAAPAETPCIAVEHLRRLGDILAPTPPYTVAAAGESDASVAPHRDGASANGEKENKHGGGSGSTKPWLSYSKPWRLPAIEAANDRRVKAQAVAQRRKDDARRADPTLTAFASQATNLREQYGAAQSAADGLRRGLGEVRASIMEEILSGRGSVDFPVLAARLRQMGITPDG